MVDIELSVLKLFKNALLPLKPEEFAGLKAEILEDRRVRDVILYWNYKGKNLIIDGHNRYQIVQEAKREGIDISYRTEPKVFPEGTTPEMVWLWIREHQRNRRNDESLLSQLAGELYNENKLPVGRPTNESKETEEPRTTLEQISELTGRSPATIRRDGRRVEAIEKLPKTLQTKIKAGDLEVTNDQVFTLAKLEPEKVTAVASSLRTGRTTTIEAAMQEAGVTVPEKKKKTKKPAEEQPSADWDNIASNLKDKLRELQTTDAEINRLAEYNMDIQRQICDAINGDTIKTVAAAIGEYEGDTSSPKDARKQEIPAKLVAMFEDPWYDNAAAILKKLVAEAKQRARRNGFLMLDPLIEPLQQAARTILDAKPEVVCPACAGKGCDGGWCRSCGWMPAWAYNDYKAKTK